MKIKIPVTICISLASVVAGVALGSVYVPPGDIFRIIGHMALNAGLPAHIKPSTVAIVWNLRFPRALFAFIAGGALSVSGSVMQSVLRNPLASSYTLGVSSGASLGACIVIIYGYALPFAAVFTLPSMGFIFGLATILLAVALASRLDMQMQNNTIILVGMVFSLFVNAAVTLLSALSREHMQRLVFWQMGSFASKGWQPVFILAPVVTAGTVFIMHYNRELDIMTFGEEQAVSMGVNMKSVKWILLISTAALTGSAIAFAGVIGFVDLVAPHIIRRFFGPAHKYLIPMSALFGGSFMVLCDLAARTVLSPIELPVGAITAIVGAPFFAYIYFSGRSNRKGGG